MGILRIRLLHDGAQPGPPLDEALDFGIQDSGGAVHPGTAGPGGTLCFAVDLPVKKADTDRPVFGGPFAHGPPAARFLYLSWKRREPSAAPWGWRIKVPLSAIGWTDVLRAERDGASLTADATGRRPHASEPIVWRFE